MSKHKVINLALDNDKAGMKGAFKIHKELGRHSEINVIPFRKHDPAELTEQEWLKAYSSKVSFMQFEVALIKRNLPLYNEIKKEIYANQS